MLAKEEFSGIAGNIESSVGGIRQDINLLVFDLNKTNVDLNAHKRTRSISAHSLSCKTVNAAGTKFASDYNATADKNGFTAIKCTSICSIGAKLKCLVGERKVGGTEYIVPCEEEQKFKKADLSTASMRCICCS
jgi:hypothetical protein